ncbi:energy-coupling factor ABC transporter ATP-binding protein [Rhodobacteraceae bacterium D3-12]|nr:energy-coupling factor ABC transporter ATP-binding protein [Rhodobacteraceae bacterium D3-12]
MFQSSLQKVTNSAARLVLDEMSVSFEAYEALSGLTLDLSFNRLGIVGRNGSGKSTLARVIAGLVGPSAGTIRLNNLDLFADRHAALREVGILFQNPDNQIIFPTVLEELAFGLAQLGLSKSDAQHEAHNTLAKFSKQAWSDVSIATLSQGQKHLVCLMAIVAMNPRCLILDEPFAGLDIPTKAQLRRYLALFPGAVIHVSHDPADLVDSDQMLWLDKGRIAASGDQEQVNASYLAEMNRQGERDDISNLPG